MFSRRRHFDKHCPRISAVEFFYSFHSGITPSAPLQKRYFAQFLIGKSQLPSPRTESAGTCDAKRQGAGFYPTNLLLKMKPLTRSFLIILCLLAFTLVPQTLSAQG